ncbi:tail length tape-measure protein [Streptococcus phage Javan226]|uniref:Phage tail length tape-measure protein n=1 Tax=Streptococcus gallolyticus TaxID=315405 RepID=A0A139R468_9STRE|nr:tape measure protein [Streptococcus gallolyticus]KXU09425.1 Phage tail length tape-measure protein [Streptococcus gallolyticus]QBX25062.1 tail length tape-measure protein [Streptococcus phage Javan226]
MSNNSYTVEAVLKANDSGFSNAFKNAQKSVSGLSSMAAKTGSMFKSVLGANLVSSALTSGISAISGGIRSMGTELNSSQKAWKTFEGNLQAFGRSSEQIAAAKSEMQDFATQTIYSASDMASTYSQLDAVGTKNVGSLVKAFGGLAASAENPAQAMKSISMQATQMASKPKIAWMDFKIMMEQAPAGMAAVAKEMGMSTDELVAAVQDGKVNTEEFFDAMNRAGNSEAFQKMATEFKTVDQAIDGAKETLSNKLMPAFEKLNQFGIKAVVALTDALDNIDFGKIADNLGKTLDSIDIEGMFSKAQTAMKMFFNPLFVINFKAAIDEVKGAVGALTSAFSGVAGGGWSWVYTLSNAVSALIGTVATGASIVKKFINAFADTGAMQQIKFAIDSVITAYTTLTYAVGEASIWSTLGTVVGNVAKVIAQVVQAIADFISRLDPSIVQGFTNVLVGGIAGLLAFSAGTKLVSTGMKGLDFIKSFNPFKLFKKNAEDSLDGTTNSVSRSKSTIAQLFSGLTNIIKGVGTSFKSIFDGIGKTLTGLGKTFEGFGKGIGAAVKGLMQGLKGLNPATLLSFGAAVGIAAVGIGAGIGIIVASLSLLAEHSAGVSVIIQALGTAFATVATAIIGAFAQAIVTVSGVLPVVTSALANLAPLVVAVGVAIGATAPAITALGDAISSVVASVGVALPPIIAAISNAITQIGLMLGTILPPIITSLGSAISQIAVAITPIVGIISSAFVQIVTVVSNAIVQIIQALAPFIPAITEMVVAVAPVLSQIVDAFNNLISQISPIIDSIANLFKTLGEQISNILDSASGVITSFGDSVRNVLDGVAGIFDSMGNAALNAGKGVKQMAQGIKILVDMKLGDLTFTLAAVATGLGDMSSHASGMSTLGTAMTQVGTGMALFAASSVLALTSLTTFGTAITTLKTNLTQLPAAMTTAGAGFQTFTTQAISGVAGLSGVNAPIAAFKAQIMTLTPAIVSATAGFAMFGTRAMVITTSFAIIGGLINAFNARILSMSAATSAAGASFGVLTSRVGALGGALSSISTGFARVGTSASSSAAQMRSIISSTQAVISAFNSMRAQIQSSMQAILTIILSIGNQMKAQGRIIGQQTSQNIAQGISSGVGRATSAMNALMSAVRSAGMSGVSSMRSIGVYIGQGLASGMMASLGSVTAAANALVAQAERAAQAKAKIHSPSRLFRDNIGIYIGQGVAVGIERSQKYVDNAMDSMFDSIDNFNAQVSDMMSSKAVYDFDGGRFSNDIEITYRNQDDAKLDTIREALDTIKSIASRDTVLNIDGREFARATGDDISDYQSRKQEVRNLVWGLGNNG